MEEEEEVEIRKTTQQHTDACDETRVCKTVFPSTGSGSVHSFSPSKPIRLNNNPCKHIGRVFHAWRIFPSRFSSQFALEFLWSVTESITVLFHAAKTIHRVIVKFIPIVFLISIFQSGGENLPQKRNLNAFTNFSPSIAFRFFHRSDRIKRKGGKIRSRSFKNHAVPDLNI